MAIKQSSNERETENVVRDCLRKLDYYGSNNSIQVEEQKSNIENVKKFLKSASKTGKGGIGSPEFIISNIENPDFLVIIECKASHNNHISKTLLNNLNHPVDDETTEAYNRRTQKYAADGILHYASRLSKEFNIISVAVSGTSETNVTVTTYLTTKGTNSHKQLTTKDGKGIDKLIPWTDYIQNATYDPSIQRMRFEELMAFSRELHDFMRDHAKLTESEKPLVVSGTLIALRSPAFLAAFSVYSPEELQKEWMRNIKNEFQKADIPKAKKDNMAQPYSSIAVHPELGKPTKSYPKGVLHELIKRLSEKVWPFISIYHDFDVVGQFYGEFLKYTGGDKKALGIVLTPRHITELFAQIANVNKSSKVLDICAGTGGFLISAMHRMLKDADTEQERYDIKKYGLIGVEQQPNMFALAASNMILRGDGKANLHQSSCFDEAITKDIKSKKCNVGLLNPPFSQGDADLHELHFVRHMLDCLAENGTGIAIVPMSCAISPHPVRTELLKKHTLEAVMTMPDDLFHPVGTVTCVMVFTAKVPHSTSNKKTWFGYWKNDGFIKTKNLGRVDSNHTWKQICDHWTTSFRNREIHAGESVMQQVTAEDEWCAEAYMETDYTKLTKCDFEQAVKNYAVFKLSTTSSSSSENYKDTNWKLFYFQDLFEIKKGKRLTKANMNVGTTPFIGAIDSNNGLTAFIDQEPIHSGNTITVNYNGNGVADAYYQSSPFWCSDDVNVLYPKFELTPEIALFITTVIRKEKYRFSYGRKWHVARMKVSTISLPCKTDGTLDLKFMQDYISTLPFSKEI